jgi:hypothetical protein
MKQIGWILIADIKRLTRRARSIMNQPLRFRVNFSRSGSSPTLVLEACRRSVNESRS